MSSALSQGPSRAKIAFKFVTHLGQKLKHSAEGASFDFVQNHYFETSDRTAALKCQSLGGALEYSLNYF